MHSLGWIPFPPPLLFTWGKDAATAFSISTAWSLCCGDSNCSTAGSTRPVARMRIKGFPLAVCLLVMAETGTRRGSLGARMVEE